MKPDSSVQYVVYNLATYFSNQPRDMKFCPACKKMLFINDIPRSRAVTENLSHDSSMSKYYFTRLYKCSACNWWAVREAWESFLERGYDYLIVNTVRSTEARTEYSSPWSLVLENVDVYNDVMTLPDSLGRFFPSRQNNIPTSLEPGDKVCLIADVAAYQPTLYFVGTQGSHGTITAFTEYSMTLERLKKRLQTEGTLDLELIEFKFWEAEFEMRKGFYCAVRIDKLEPPSAGEIGGMLCKEGEVYLFDTLSLKKVG